MMKHKKNNRPDRTANGTEHDLDDKYYELEEQIRKLQVGYAELNRRLDELEYFTGNAGERTEVPHQSGMYTSELVATEVQQQEPSMRTRYYLQPNMDGLFKETSEVSQAEDALYAITYSTESPETGTLKFIDAPDNVILALQNEPTWVLVACERENMPTERTRSIRTDEPGTAILNNGTWEIVCKAKITYV